MKIGLVGEYPTDSIAVEKLLSKFYKGKYSFFSITKNIPNGDSLATKFGRRLIKIEYQNQSPNLLIYIRDLDALFSDKDKLQTRQTEFQKLQKEIDGVCVFMLNVYELEALIYGDIETFNQEFGVSIAAPENPMKVISPKEELMSKTVNAVKTYHFETHNQELFSKLNPDNIYINHKGFKDFILELKNFGLSKD